MLTNLNNTSITTADIYKLTKHKTPGLFAIIGLCGLIYILEKMKFYTKLK